MFNFFIYQPLDQFKVIDQTPVWFFEFVNDGKILFTNLTFYTFLGPVLFCLIYLHVSSFSFFIMEYFDSSDTKSSKFCNFKIFLM